MSDSYYQMQQFYRNLFAPPYTHDFTRKDEFVYRGKYHSFVPHAEHRHAGYHPFAQVEKPEFINLVKYPEHVFQNAPLHHYIPHHENYDIIEIP